MIEYTLFKDLNLNRTVQRDQLEIAFNNENLTAKVCISRVWVRMRELRSLPVLFESVSNDSYQNVW